MTVLSLKWKFPYLERPFYIETGLRYLQGSVTREFNTTVDIYEYG